MFEYGEAHHPPAFPNALPGLYTHRVRSTGPQVVVANRIAFHPEKPETFAVAYMDYGLFLTRDGGKWWEWAWKGMVSPFSRLLARQVAYDPDQPERVYVVGGKYDGGVAYIHRSDDGGRTFTPYPVEPLRKALEAFKGKQSQAVGITDLLPDPASPVEKRRFYLATTIGLFHGSLEGPWEKISEGLPESVFGLRVASDGSQQLMLDPANPKRLYFYGRGAQRRAATSDAGLYCYEDGEWKRLGPEQIGAVSSFSLSQQQPDLLYVVAAEAGVGPGGTSTPTRLLISRDRGATWSQGDAPPGLITGAYLHPSHPERVYLLTHTLKDPVQEPTMIYRRDAAGEPWHPMSAPGMAFSMTPFGPCSIAFPPHDPQRFYLIPNSGIYEITETGRTDR